jgi:hypothetical protein
MDLFAKRNFSLEQVPDLTGKVAIITGSNTGVSFIFTLGTEEVLLILNILSS